MQRHSFSGRYFYNCRIKRSTAGLTEHSENNTQAVDSWCALLTLQTFPYSNAMFRELIRASLNKVSGLLVITASYLTPRRPIFMGQSFHSAFQNLTRYSVSRVSDAFEYLAHRFQLRSKRSRFITLVHASTKSRTNFWFPSLDA